MKKPSLPGREWNQMKCSHCCSLLISTHWSEEQDWLKWKESNAAFVWKIRQNCLDNKCCPQLLHSNLTSTQTAPSEYITIGLHLEPAGERGVNNVHSILAAHEAGVYSAEKGNHYSCSHSGFSDAKYMYSIIIVSMELSELLSSVCDSPY